MDEGQTGELVLTNLDAGAIQPSAIAQVILCNMAAIPAPAAAHFSCCQAVFWDV